MNVRSAKETNQNIYQSRQSSKTPFATPKHSHSQEECATGRSLFPKVPKKVDYFKKDPHQQPCTDVTCVTLGVCFLCAPKSELENFEVIMTKH